MGICKQHKHSDGCRVLKQFNMVSGSSTCILWEMRDGATHIDEKMP